MAPRRNKFAPACSPPRRRPLWWCRQAWSSVVFRRSSERADLGSPGAVGEAAAAAALWSFCPLVLSALRRRLLQRRWGTWRFCTGVGRCSLLRSRMVTTAFGGRPWLPVQGCWTVAGGAGVLLRRGRMEAAALRSRARGDVPRPMRHSGEGLAVRGEERLRLVKRLPRWRASGSRRVGFPFLRPPAAVAGGDGHWRVRCKDSKGPVSFFFFWGLLCCCAGTGVLPSSLRMFLACVLCVLC